MTHEQLEAKVVEMAAQRLAMRDVVARLLSHVARNEPNPESILKEFFEAGDARVDKKPDPSAVDVGVAETIRREKDWIVVAARTML